MWKNGHLPATPETPLILGHEMAGLIEEVGAGVVGYQVGQRVCVAPNYNPVPSRLVTAGEGHLDPHYRALGIHEHGSFAEFVRIPREGGVAGQRLPDSRPRQLRRRRARRAVGVRVQCLRESADRPGRHGAHHRCGVPSASCTRRFRRWPARGKVIINDVHAERLQIASELDPDFITVSGEPGDELMRLTDGAGADVVITACPVASVQTRALELAAVNGRVIFFGGLPKGKSLVPLDTNIIHYKQLMVTGTTRQSLKHFQKVLDLISNRLIEVEDLITSTHSLDDIQTAINNAAQASGLKTRIAFMV